MEIERNPSKRRRWLTAYAPFVVWIVVIIGLGSSVGAMSETSRFIRPLLEYLLPSAAPETLTIYHGYIRKLAHLTEYAILAILAMRVFWNVSRSFLMVIGVVALVAVVDELNQSFDPSRTGAFFDVLIDLAGGFLGLTLWGIAVRFSRKT